MSTPQRETRRERSREKRTLSKVVEGKTLNRKDKREKTHADHPRDWSRRHVGKAKERTPVLCSLVDADAERLRVVEAVKRWNGTSADTTILGPPDIIKREYARSRKSVRPGVMKI